MQMPDKPSLSLLISDACVLIDLAKAEALGLLADMTRNGIAEIYVPKEVLEEVMKEVSESALLSLGVKRIEKTWQEAMELVELYEQKFLPSETDCLLYILGRHHGLTIWTNDIALRKKSMLDGVSVSWCFEELSKLVEFGLRSADEIIAVAKKVEETNNYHKGLTARVRARLQSIGLNIRGCGACNSYSGNDRCPPHDKNR